MPVVRLAAPRERPAAHRAAQADLARDGFLFLHRDKFAGSLAVGLALAQAVVKADSRVPDALTALGGAVADVRGYLRLAPITEVPGRGSRS